MRLFSYRGVQLEIVYTRDVVREAIYTQDGTTYLYTKTIIDVDCVYNPKATSYGIGPFRAADNNPDTTDINIRHFLMQPRGKLIAEVNGRWIESPFGNLRTDALNGPFPERCEVKEIQGTKSFMISYRIVTYLNECGIPGASGTLNQTDPNPLLSHRWKRFVDTDKDYFSMVVTEGEAIFRTDELLRLGTYPDQYRRDLMHPIDPNMKREHIFVLPSEDGSSVRYRIEDREQAFNLGRNAPCTRIEAYQTNWYSKTGNLQAAVAGAGAVFVGAGGGAAAGAVVGSWIPGIGTVAGAVIGGLIGTAREAVSAGQAALPQAYFHVIVRIYGQRNHERRRLQHLALGVALARLGSPVETLNTEMILTHDLTGKFVELQLTYRAGPEQLLRFVGVPIATIPPELRTAVAASGVIGWAGVLNQMPAEESIFVPWEPYLPPAGYPLPFFAVSQESIGNPQPPNSNDSRGTWLGKLVAQVLSEPCQLPPKPPRFPLTLPLPPGSQTRDERIYPG